MTTVRTRRTPCDSLMKRLAQIQAIDPRRSEHDRKLDYESLETLIRAALEPIGKRLAEVRHPDDLPARLTAHSSSEAP